MADQASRTFAAAFHLGQIEAKGESDGLARGAALARSAERALSAFVRIGLLRREEDWDLDRFADGMP